MGSFRDRYKQGPKPAVPPEQPAVQRGVPFQVSTQSPPGEPELPAQAGALSDRLQDIARRYIGARRRSGEALLEAARWLSEARAEAQHGEWQVFLEATNTSDDTAERLLNIHSQAMQNPQFADSVRNDRIGQSVAALLARPSTPPEVVAEILSAPEPPSVTGVQRALRRSRLAKAGSPAPDAGQGSRTSAAGRQVADAQNPQFADFERIDHAPTASLSALSPPTMLDVLREVVISMTELARAASTLPGGPDTERALEQIEQALLAIRQATARRR